MFIRAVVLALLLLLLFPATVCSGTRDPNTPDEKYVEFAKQFPFVVRVRGLTEVIDSKTGEPRKSPQTGSGVVIKPHWILTAAHVVSNVTEPRVQTDSGAIYPLTKIIIPKEFLEDKIGYYDLALCYSPTAFDLSFYPGLHTDHDEFGKAVTIAGYGLTGTFHTGCILADEKKRAGHNVVEGEEMAILTCKPTAGSKRMPLEYMISPGDSGGGMFIGNKLAGINSYLSATDKKPDGTYGDESAFTRVSLYADWVESQIEKYELALAAQATTAGELNFAVTPIVLNIPEPQLILP